MKLSRILNLLIILTWIGLLFASQATDPLSFGFQVIYRPLQTFYNTGVGDTFPGFEIISFCLLIVVFIRYSKNNKLYFPGNWPWTFIIITLLFVTSSLVNPNNSVESGLFDFIKMRITRTIIFYFLALVILFTISYNSYIDFIRRFFVIGLYIGIFRATLDLFGFLTKTGVVNDYERNITTYGGDIQLWFSIFSILSFSIFLYLKRRKYLYFSLLFFICLLFSYQRTAFFVTLIFYASFYLAYLFIFTRRFFRYFFITIVVFVFVFFAGSVFLKTEVGKDIFLRYSSALLFTGYVEIDNSQEPEYTDSGHFIQSKTVTEFLFKNAHNFWGGGINRRNENYLMIKGQSSGGVHNNIVSLWQYFGVPGLIYFVWLTVFVLFYYFRSLTTKNRINFNRFIILSISNYFIIRFIAGWFSGDFFYMYYQICFQYIILISFFRLFSKPDILIILNHNETTYNHNLSLKKDILLDNNKRSHLINQ
jgi:hypothetical protein